MADGQLVDEAGYVADGQVVVTLAVVGLEIIDVLDGRCVAFEGGTGLIERLRVSEGVEQSKSVDKALLIANLQRIVIRGEFVKGLGDI